MVEEGLPEPVYPQYTYARWETDRKFHNFKAWRTWKGLGAPYFKHRLMPGDIDFLFSHPGEEVAPREIPVGTAMAHWKFDETSGTVAGDSSGQNHTAILNGAASFSGGTLFCNDMPTSFATLPVGILVGTSDFTIATWVNRTRWDKPSRACGRRCRCRAMARRPAANSWP